MTRRASNADVDDRRPRAHHATAAVRWRALAARPVLCAGAAIGALTLLGAAAGALEPTLGPGGHPHPTLHGTPGEALDILMTNAATLVIPLALAAGRWHTARGTRQVGDALVAALVAANALLVGAAIGRHGIALAPYLPHLPLEDAALAIAAGAWISRRDPDHRARAALPLGAYAALTAAVTAAAALVETYAVPHA